MSINEKKSLLVEMVTNEDKESCLDRLLAYIVTISDEEDESEINIE